MPGKVFGSITTRAETAGDFKVEQRETPASLSRSGQLFATAAVPLPGAAGAGVFVSVSRANHSCRPNSCFHFDEASFVSPLGQDEAM